MNLQNLRRIASNQPIHETANSEQFLTQFLDEAYFGGDAVIKIERAMVKIHQKVSENPRVAIYKDASNAELEAAVKEVFGFKSVNVYWGNEPGMQMIGPHTRPGCIFFRSKEFVNSFGGAKNGFYDKKHELKVYIQMYQNLITDAKLTPRELTAILLHEIGHNFDATPITIIDAWYRLITVCTSGNITAILQYAGSSAIQEYGREVVMAITNLNTYIMDTVPPIGTFLRSVGKVGFNVFKFMNAILNPVLAPVIIPAYLLFMPFYWISNFVGRKKEIYADTFAAAYGYAAEQATALDKLNYYILSPVEPGKGGVLNFFYDYAIFQQEFVSMCMGGHRSNQQRMITMMDAMEKDMNNPSVPAELKRELKTKLEEARKTYNSMMGMNENDRKTFTTMFRKMVNNWYDGKPYVIMPSMTGDDYAH